MQTWPDNTITSAKPFSLVLEDDEALASGYQRVLESLGYEVAVCHRVIDARTLIRDRAPDLLLIDIDLPDGNGLDLMDELRNDTRGRFIVISGDTSQRAAIKSIRHRAVELLIKPVSLKVLRERLGQDVGKVNALRHTDHHTEADCWIVHGQNHALSLVRTAISYCAERSRGHALITGESGVDKPSVARYIHQRGRRPGSCIVVDCSAEQGLTGMIRMFGQENPDTGELVHEGYIDQAAAGTLVLDYVEQLPATMQSRLLPLLDTGYFKRVDGRQGAAATLSIVGIARETGTADVDETALRSDFLFRLAQTTLSVPNLRQCGDDVTSIAQFLLSRASVERPDDLVFSEQAQLLIRRTPWLRNIRELQSAIERSVADTADGAEVELSNEVLGESADTTGSDIDRWIGTSVWEMERQLLHATLAHFDGDKELTSRTLGVSLKTLYNRMNAY